MNISICDSETSILWDESSIEMDVEEAMKTLSPVKRNSNVLPEELVQNSSKASDQEANNKILWDESNEEVSVEAALKTLSPLKRTLSDQKYKPNKKAFYDDEIVHWDDSDEEIDFDAVMKTLSPIPRDSTDQQVSSKRDPYYYNESEIGTDDESSQQNESDMEIEQLTQKKQLEASTKQRMVKRARNPYYYHESEIETDSELEDERLVQQISAQTETAPSSSCAHLFKELETDSEATISIPSDNETSCDEEEYEESEDDEVIYSLVKYKERTFDEEFIEIPELFMLIKLENCFRISALPSAFIICSEVISLAGHTVDMIQVPWVQIDGIRVVPADSTLEVFFNETFSLEEYRIEDFPIDENNHLKVNLITQNVPIEQCQKYLYIGCCMDVDDNRNISYSETNFFKPSLFNLNFYDNLQWREIVEFNSNYKMYCSTYL